jgi:hypothetical protein
MHPAVLAVGPWNGSWHEYRPYARVSGASRAFRCAIAAGRASADFEHPTLNPRVRGSSPWRRTRSGLMFCRFSRLRWCGPWAQVDQGMAARRAVGLAAPPGRPSGRWQPQFVLSAAGRRLRSARPGGRGQHRGRGPRPRRPSARGTGASALSRSTIVRAWRAPTGRPARREPPQVHPGVALSAVPRPRGGSVSTRRCARAVHTGPPLARNR